MVSPKHHGLTGNLPRTAVYLIAVALPLATILLAVRLGAPAFVFEHLMVLLVVAVAIAGGFGPALVVAVTGSVGDNLLLREPVGRPAITGVRDVIDLGLFVLVAGTVGWLVHRLRAARAEALDAAMRERFAREERDRLVATVTHDLATPLGAIQGTIQFARRNAALSSLDLPRLLTRVETAAGRATSLLRTLRDVRSLDHDELSLTLSPVDLRTIVEPIAQMLDRVSDRHPVVLAMTHEPVPVLADEERLGRVIENLITNAIKYSPGGGAVEVSVGTSGDNAVVSVRDYGIGIPEEDLGRIFESGFRASGSGTVAPGLGLGLFIAAEIVGRHSGTIDARRQPPKGTVVTVCLPISGAARQPSRPGAEVSTRAAS